MGEVVRIANLADEDLGSIVLEDDPPAILVDALAVYFAARRAVRAHYQEIERKRLEREREAAAARARRR